ncbi:MAG: two pore domain potassium channel family protein [Deltaproteobacteria bacterium]|nr:two pore domain potassium channel family protein [Deltaproteobacteria bacterium]
MDHYRTRLRIYLTIFGAVLVAGVLGFSYAEKVSIPDALYFSIVTVATVGYGDIHPQTGAGKFLAVLLIVGGVGTFLGVIASATEILLSRREEEVRREKLHMVTSLFFSELGNRLLSLFANMDTAIDIKQRDFAVSPEWDAPRFRERQKQLDAHSYAVKVEVEDLEGIHKILEARADLLLRLLENPLVIEHGSFSDLLRAVFHLRDELMNRRSFAALPEPDRRHLAGDVARIYRLLIGEWLSTMLYLKQSYPFLFSLALRTNPFDPQASVIVQDA